MKRTYALSVIWVCTMSIGCLDPIGEQRPGPKDEGDAELFDARQPPAAPNTGSGYGGSGTYQSAGYPLQRASDALDEIDRDDDTWDGGMMDDVELDADVNEAD